MTSDARWPRLGYGAGLRAEHYPDVLGERRPDDRISWFEAITENYMDTGGRPLAVLEQVRKDFPVALHGVGLSIGSTDALNERYLDRLSNLVARIAPAFVTDHLCWTGVDGRSSFDLLPIPYTEEALAHVVERVARVQERLGRPILLENPSTYVTFRDSTIAEWDFLAAVAERADCGILLDINNVYVSAYNHGFDADAYLAALPPRCIGQIHLAGYTDRGSYLFDTHSAPVAERVWDLYAAATERFGEVSTLVEWDADIPPFERLGEEVERARAVATAALAAKRTDATAERTATTSRGIDSRA